MSESFGEGLSVISWNVRSMSNKFHSIKERIIKTRPDIVCIGESWLRHILPDSIVSIQGYTLIRNDRKILNNLQVPRRGGGVCTYMKNGLSFTPLTGDIFNPSCENLEAQTINLHLPATRPIFIINIYRPPQGDVERMLEAIQELLSHLTNANKREIFILGDFNIDLTKSTCPSTKKLKTFRIRNNSLKQWINTPTRVTDRGGILELIITNSSHIQVANPLSWNISDYLPVYFTRKKSKTTYQKIV